MSIVWFLQMTVTNTINLSNMYELFQKPIIQSSLLCKYQFRDHEQDILVSVGFHCELYTTWNHLGRKSPLEITYIVLACGHICAEFLNLVDGHRKAQSCLSSTIP